MNVLKTKTEKETLKVIEILQMNLQGICFLNRNPLKEGIFRNFNYLNGCIQIERKGSSLRIKCFLIQILLRRVN